MGYRGDDASRDRADSRRQQPWRQSDRHSGDDYNGGHDGQQSYDSRHGYDSQQGYRGQQGYGGQQGYDDGYGSYGGPGSGAHRQQGGYDSRDGYGSQDGYSQRGDYGHEPDGYGRPQHGYDDGYGPYRGGSGSGGYRQQDGYGADDGYSGGRPDNDWYGGRGGAGFADTSAVPRPDARNLPDYLTGGNSGDGRDAAHGRPAGPDSRAAFPAPPAIEASPAPRLTETRQQDILDDTHYSSYPGYENVDDRQGRGGSGGHAAQPGYGDDYDDYANFTPDYEVPAPTTANPAYVEPAPTTANPGFAALDHDDHGDGFDGQPGYGDDDYADGYAEAAPPGARSQSAAGGARKKRTGGARSSADKRRRKTGVLILSGGCVIAVLAAVYFIFIKPNPASNGANAPLPSPGSSAGAAPACSANLGQYCHITSRTDDPTPLTVNELFPPIFQNENDHISFQRIGTRLDKTCSNAVVGQSLTSAVEGGACSQVLRASYTEGSGSSEIMGTIGVINFQTTNEAHKAGKMIGTSDFLAPLSTNSGVGANLGQSTGVVMSQFKGHYLILTWAELAKGKSMSGQPSATQNKQLEQFENDLVADTANIDLSQRMVTGKPPTNGS